jgi:hypothetical protein
VEKFICFSSSYVEEGKFGHITYTSDNMHALFIHCIIDCSISHNRSIRSGEASYVFLQVVIIDYGCESQLHIHYKKVHLSIISHNIYIELPKFFPSLALKKPYYGFCVQLLFLSTFFWQDKHVLVL